MIRTTEVGGGSILVSGEDSLGCFEVDGSRRWVFRFSRKAEVVADNQTFTYSARQDGVSPLVVVPETGLVYLAAANAVLYALDMRSGDLVWLWRESATTFESITYGDGRIFVSTTDFKQYALDAKSGAVLWGGEFRRVSSWTTGYFRGMLVRPDVDGRVWGMNGTTGLIAWRYESGAEIQYQWDPDLHFHSSGLGFMMNLRGTIWAYNVTNGAIVWRADASAGYRSALDRGDDRQTFEVWGDLVIVHSLEAYSTGSRGYGLLQALDVFTGKRVWIRDNVLRGRCGMVITQNQLVYTSFTVASVGTYTSFTAKISAADAAGNDVWSIQNDNMECMGQLQELGGVVVALQADTRNRTTLDGTVYVVTLPATPSVSCPPDIKSTPDTAGGPSGDVVAPQAPASPPPPPFVSRVPYCWRQSFSYKPLGSPTADGVRAYGQDNAGLVLAVYLETGAIAWKATCGPDGIAARYPSNVIVVDGVVYLGCSNLEVQARDAVTGHLLWRHVHVTPPDRTLVTGSLLGYPAVVNGKIIMTRPDGFLRALNITNGEEVWRYDTGARAIDSVAVRDGVVYGIGRDGEGPDPNLIRVGSVIALDVDTGNEVFVRDLDRWAMEPGHLNFHNGTLVYATGWPDARIQAMSIGRDAGGNVAWTYGIPQDTGVWTVLVVAGEELGLPHDALFYHSDQGRVTALALGSDGPTEVMWTLDLTDTELWPEVENLLTPGPPDWAQISYSNKTLYIPTSQGMFVAGATDGAPLWTDLRSRLNSNIFVIERPGGPQVVYGRYLNSFESNTPQCRPNKPSGGFTPLQVDSVLTTRPAASPAPSPAPLTSSPNDVVASASPAPSPAPAPSRSPVPSPAASPAPSPAPMPSVSRSPSPAPAVCPPCPAANCSAPTQSASAPAPVTVALGLSGLPYSLVKADSKLRDRVAGAVEKLVSGKVTGSVRVRVLGVDSAAGGKAAVLRLSLQRSGGASASAVSSAVEDAALSGKLQEVVLAAKVPGKVRSVVVQV
ncbi:hypothetical protein HXX76_001202 [Chlamydomonas incerta]|uniref:Pyrrolo-quinoline quinone repeat domain-containing protein n=1 Tax=Chlamydomonas incerta TaxID=51695 RepID=A0A835WBP0_CHLIN|nr:hypothetical protein HXX76_001202 [Chlamydomonas incerta]|eukprot:KAG2444449.1 hypothetical protein HXX76_001202 [Chlamydomonas incerta]